MILVINGMSFNQFVVVGTYDVNRQYMYSTWEDLYHKEHRSDIRRRVVGTFDVYFKNETDYIKFVDRAYREVETDGTVQIKCSVNNSYDTFEGRVYLEYAPVRSRTSKGVDYMEQFTVTIEEDMR